MVVTRLWLGLGLVASLCAASALGQEAPQRYSADELTAILKRNTSPEFSADELANILDPARQQPQVRTRSLSPGAGVEPGTPGSGVVPDLRIRFEYNSEALTPDARAQLDELGAALQTEALRPYRFEIGGHTDAVGSAGYNQQLSQRRAASVASYLSERGVGPDRLDPVGYGEERLADQQDPESGVNRRVEIRTLN